MKNICIDMLSDLEEKIAAVKDFDLTSVCTSKQYQEYLENIFGEGGDVTAIITENQLLTPNERSFFLLLAIFVEQGKFYRILDQIYSMSLCQIPGYNWELLISLKNINDHCFNSKISQTNDHVDYTDTPAIDIFLNNFKSDNLIISEHDFRLALRCVIAKSIKTLDQERNLNPIDYKDEQRRIIRLLSKHLNNANWRLQKSGMTLEQIQQGGKGIFSIYNSLRLAGVTFLHNEVEQHRIGCKTPACSLETRLIESIITINVLSDNAIADNELVMLKESHKLYTEQLKSVVQNPDPEQSTSPVNRCTIS